MDKSAIGYLLQNGQQGGIADLEMAINKQVDNLDSVSSCLPPEPCQETYAESLPDKVELLAQNVEREVDRQWRISSYSGLVKHGSHHQQHDATIEVAGFDIDSSEDDDTSLTIEPERSIFTFPKGARAGTFLHTLFEEVDFTASAYDKDNQKIIENLLVNEQLEQEWLPILQSMVETVLTAPLDGKALKLREKQADQRLVEMEFLLPVSVLSASELNRLTHRYDTLSAKAGELGFQSIKGMLKGFIDLVFEHQGKYYVLDWKSNHLGDDVSYYHGEALRNAMSEHRYDLQYQIYSLALHRFLRSRIPDYSYEQHFGGVYYLFLRGIDGQSDNGIFCARPEQDLIEKFDQMLEGKSEQANDDMGQMELDF